jgi:serine/threonine protein kinase
MPRPSDSDDVLLPPGEVIDGKYEIISKIGQGGMGVVYKARDTVKREVALKMLTHVDEKTLQRFRLEALALGKVQHRGVIRVDAFGNSSQGPYLVVEYVAGRDLSSVAKFPLPLEEAVDLTLAICSGVSACHAVKVVHRDLKPSNVRVRNVSRWSERVKILDFGLALDFDSPIRKAAATRITHLGEIPGTLRYIAPELLRHQTATPQCDQYAIGSMAYLMLTGRAPFHDLDGDELITAILHGDYVAIRMLRSGLPTDLQSAITRSLALDPTERFETVNDFALALVPYATPSLQKSHTRSFGNAQHIDRRLIEPVSSLLPPSPAPLSAANIAPIGPSVPILTPLPEPIRGTPPKVSRRREPSDRPPAAVAIAPVASPPLPSPAPQVAVASRPPPLPSPEPPRTGRKSKSARDYDILFVFICGAGCGAAFTVGAFICFLLYQHHTASYPPIPVPAPVVHASPPGNR